MASVWLIATNQGYVTRSRTVTRDLREGWRGGRGPNADEVAWRHHERLTAERIAADLVEVGAFAPGELQVIALGAPLPR